MRKEIYFKYMHKLLFLIILFLLVIVGVKVIHLHPVENISKQEVIEGTIGDITLNLEIAKTPSDRIKGLSGRTALEESEGLLFVFPKPGKYGFWMKDMNFPIDIIWIDKNMRVLGASEELTPESYPKSYYPPSEVQFVLEVPAGFYKRHSLKVGEGLFLKSQNDVLEGVF